MLSIHECYVMVGWMERTKTLENESVYSKLKLRKKYIYKHYILSQKYLDFEKNIRNDKN